MAAELGSPQSRHPLSTSSRSGAGESFSPSSHRCLWAPGDVLPLTKHARLGRRGGEASWPFRTERRILASSGRW